MLMGAAERASKYKGVSWNRTTQRWEVRIFIDASTQRFLGSFDSEEAAARKYDTAAAWLRKPHNFARTCHGEARSAPRNDSAELPRPVLGHIQQSSKTTTQQPQHRSIDVSFADDSVGENCQKKNECTLNAIDAPKHQSLQKNGAFTTEKSAMSAAALQRQRPANGDVEQTQPAAEHNKRKHAEELGDATKQAKVSRSESTVAGSQASSKYKGVTRAKQDQKWQAYITIDGKSKYLGYFASEEDAARKFDESAASLNKPLNFPGAGQKKAIKQRSSKYKGVSWNQRAQKWMAHITIDGKKTYLGYFDSEKAAAHKFDEAAASLGRRLNFPNSQPVVLEMIDAAESEANIILLGEAEKHDNVDDDEAAAEAVGSGKKSFVVRHHAEGTYIGQVERGLMHGFGQYKSSRGSSTYVGAWREGRFHGNGVFSCAENGSFAGNFVDGEACHGELTTSFASELYIGEDATRKHDEAAAPASRVSPLYLSGAQQLIQAEQMSTSGATKFKGLLNAQSERCVDSDPALAAVRRGHEVFAMTSAQEDFLDLCFFGPSV